MLMYLVYITTFTQREGEKKETHVASSLKDMLMCLVR